MPPISPWGTIGLQVQRVRTGPSPSRVSPRARAPLLRSSTQQEVQRWVCSERKPRQDVTSSGGRWPLSPSIFSDCPPSLRMTRCVIEACGNVIRNHVSGGIWGARRGELEGQRVRKPVCSLVWQRDLAAEAAGHPPEELGRRRSE